MINQIEHNVNIATVYIQKGGTEASKAVVYKRRSRRVSLCTLCVHVSITAATLSLIFSWEIYFWLYMHFINNILIVTQTKETKHYKPTVAATKWGD